MNTLKTISSSAEPKAAPESSALPKPRHNVPLGRIAFILAVLILVGAVAGFIPRLQQRSEAQNDVATLDATTVTLVSPEPGKASDGLVLPAEVQPMTQASIFARVSGYLKKWNVDIGARVTAGQVLAEIDTPEIDQQLDQARSQLGVAEANLKLAQITDTRWQTLLHSNTVSKQEADEKSAAVAVGAASAEAARANVRRLEETQSFQRVVAPFAGIITARNVDIGDLISIGGSRELFHLAQTETLRVYVQVPQTQAEGIRTGQTAEVLIPELPNEPFPAIVVTNSEAMSATSRTLLTELQVDNSEGRIRIGSYAQVRFGSVAAAPALTLPSSALIFRSEGLQVGIVDAQGVVELRNVELGRDFGQRVEILSGVTAADKVIATPSTHSSAAWPSASLPPPSHSEWADFRDHRRVDGENLDRLATSRFQITPPCVSAPSTPSCGWWPRTKVPTNGMCLPRSDERVAARAFRGSGRMRRIVFRKRRHISSVRCR